MDPKSYRPFLARTTRPGAGRMTMQALLQFGQLMMAAFAVQSAPAILSVTPQDGATGVATNSTVVFVFDQEMNTSITPFKSVPPLLSGNFEIQPTNVCILGSWGLDKKTLTLKANGGLPYGTQITWTLNPTGTAQVTFPKFSSASGQELPTVTGGFTTAAFLPPPTPPKVIEVSPTNGATAVGRGVCRAIGKGC